MRVVAVSLAVEEWQPMNRLAETVTSWLRRLWIRLTSRRATPEEIASQKIPQEELDRATAKLMRRMDGLRGKR